VHSGEKALDRLDGDEGSLAKIIEVASGKHDEAVGETVDSEDLVSDAVGETVDSEDLASDAVGETVDSEDLASDADGRTHCDKDLVGAAEGAGGISGAFVGIAVDDVFGSRSEDEATGGEEGFWAAREDNVSTDCDDNVTLTDGSDSFTVDFDTMGDTQGDVDGVASEGKDWGSSGADFVSVRGSFTTAESAVVSDDSSDMSIAFLSWCESDLS
jgi:hypothetical protein